MSSISLLWATITWNPCGTLVRSLGWCFGLKKALLEVYLGFVLRQSISKVIRIMTDGRLLHSRELMFVKAHRGT